MRQEQAGEVCGYLPDKRSVIDSCRTPVRQNLNLCFPVDAAAIGDGYTKLPDMQRDYLTAGGGSKLKAFLFSSDLSCRCANDDTLKGDRSVWV